MGELITVLLVEDLPDDRFLLARALSKTGLPTRLFEVGDGLEAMEFLSHTGRFSDTQAFPRPDLLLLDLKMPGTDGFEVLTWLQEHGAHAPRCVVVLSGSELERDMRLARELGALTYLIKPATPDQLRQLLIQEFGLAA